jgi:predicted HD phosphohydrolase
MNMDIDTDTTISKHILQSIDTNMDANAIINSIIALYERLGSADYIGEHLSQYQHALQSAMSAMSDIDLMQTYNEYTRNCTITAAFLHDIGHLIGMDGTGNDQLNFEMVDENGKTLGVKGHERVGFEYLQQLGFPQLVCELVGNHVEAKRYLCTTNNKYLNTLSKASLATLYLQGGLMNEDELCNFINQEHCKLYVKMHNYDDNAKKPEFFTEASFNTNLDFFIEIMKKTL